MLLEYHFIENEILRCRYNFNQVQVKKRFLFISNIYYSLLFYY